MSHAYTLMGEVVGGGVVGWWGGGVVGWWGGAYLERGEKRKAFLQPGSFAPAPRRRRIVYHLGHFRLFFHHSPR